MIIQLTQPQLRNVLVFLSRVQLQGNEAATLTELQMIFQRAAEQEPKDKPKTDDKDSKK